MAKDLRRMRPMQRHRYLTQNNKKCSMCKKTKSLNCFYNKETLELQKQCNSCSKKLYEDEVRKIVLGVLTKSDL